MNSNRCSQLIAIALLLLALPVAAAQGALADYQRAQRFLPGNLRHPIYVADVRPHWIEKTSRFWYRKDGVHDSEFILVDAERNKSTPAFDHARLAASLSRAAHRDYPVSDLPFHEMEFVNGGKDIRFSIDEVQWTCSLTSYECQGEPMRLDEVLSPNKRWAAVVKDQNLFLRDVSTGAELRLTHDGVPGWDYATPLPSLRLMVDQGTEQVKQPAAVFWAPDSSKLVRYRIDSRNSGRFTSLQFVPRYQLRPRASTCVPFARGSLGEGGADDLRHTVGEAN